MKKLAIAFIGIIGLFALLAGCDLFPVSIEDRIDRFIADLNTDDRSEIYTHFHPNTADRDAIKDPAYFDGSPLAVENQSFSFSGGSAYDIGGGQQEVDGTFYNFGGSNNFSSYFIMEQDGESWFIREFYMDGYEITKKK